MKLNKKIFTLLLFSMTYLFFSTKIGYAAPVPPKRVSLEGIFTTDLGVSGNSASTIDDVAMITDGSPSQVGALWSTQDNLLDFKEDFTLVSYFNQEAAGFGSGGDGMVFLLQSASSTPQWFTYSGASMGALGENKYNGALGIPNSVGIEFDIYGNRSNSDGFFDNGISSVYNNNHIAVVYPGISEGYSDNYVWLGTSTRYVQHHNLINDINLVSGQWDRLELNWKTNPQDYTQGILTFKINDRAPVPIDPVYLNSQVFQNGSVSEAYWGFTGSTGPTYRAYQSIVFEQVPGLVNAQTALEVTDAAGNVLPTGSTINGNTKLNIKLTADWLSGKQNWQDILLNTALPEGLEVIPGTTKIDDVLIDDQFIWSDNNLLTDTGQIADLGTKLGNIQTGSTITFSVKAKNSSYADQVITSSFSGRNAIYDAGRFSMNIIPVSLEASIVSPEDQAVILDNDLTSLPISTNWTNEGGLGIHHFLGVEQNGQLAWIINDSEEESDAGSGLFSYDILETFKQLEYGPFIVDYTVKNQEGLSAASRITLFKQNAPTLELNTMGELPVYKIDDALTIPVKISDKDSSSFQLFLQFEGQEEIDLGHFEHKSGEDTLLEIDYPTIGMAPGKYNMTIVAVDDGGNRSNVLELNEVVIEGELKLVTFPESFSNEEVKIGGSPVKITTMNKISLLDQRVKDREWVLKANLVGTNFVNDTNTSGRPTFANDDFFYYKHDGKITNISTEPVDLAISETVPDLTEYILNQDDENGFYYNPSNSMLIGNYHATVNWSLVSAPI